MFLEWYILVGFAASMICIGCIFGMYSSLCDIQETVLENRKHSIRDHSELSSLIGDTYSLVHDTYFLVRTRLPIPPVTKPANSKTKVKSK